ncbi:MFS transporter [Peterkaempfera bronchialis]|uniref:MFS transporter n=1 Tax=Peterkaempfera bronchialis TaxID=2126346 RepID=A0A345SRE2_9ACTN|nr:MFS transporter [Peterkaempfera bronchialis]AXI76297.1 MFS transporter [Peterkaempfera bronchialis]
MTATDKDNPVRLVTPSFLGLFMAALCFFFAYGMTVPILPPFVKERLHGTDLIVGVVVGMMAVSSIVIRPLVAPRTSSWGCPRLVLVSGLVGAGAFAGYGLAADNVQLSGLRLVTGAAQATLLIAAITMVTSHAPPDRRGQAISYFSVAPYLGIGIGPVLGQTLFEHLGFRPAFAIAGVIGLAGAIPILFVPNVRVPRPAGAPRQPIFHKVALWPGTVLALGMVGAIAMSAFMPLFVSDLGASGTQWIFLAYAAVVLLVRVVGGRIPDTLGPARTGWLSTSLISLGMVGFAVTPSVLGIYLSLIPLGTGIALQYPGLLALTVNRVSEEERPRAVSTFTMFFDLATGIGGLFVGGIVAVGGYRSAFAACAACSLLGLVLLRLFVVARPTEGGAAESSPVETALPSAPVAATSEATEE